MKRIGLQFFIFALVVLSTTVASIDLSYARRTITGRVTNQADNPVEGARVRAWDADVNPDDRMGWDITDANGNYRITYRGGHWDPAPHWNTVWRPDIYMTVALKVNGKWRRVHKGRKKKNHKHKVDLVRNIKIKDVPKVFGTVRSAENNNAPVPGASVELYDFDLTSGNDFMGSAVTDGEGKYEVLYARKKWDSTNDNPDVQGKVFVGGAKQLTGRTVTADMDEPLQYDLTIPDKSDRPAAGREEEIPTSKLPPGNGGTRFIITNESGDLVIFYVDGEQEDLLFPDDMITVDVPCNFTRILQAKDQFSDVYNPVTWDFEAIGLCFAETIVVFQSIYF